MAGMSRPGLLDGAQRRPEGRGSVLRAGQEPWTGHTRHSFYTRLLGWLLLGLTLVVRLASAEGDLHVRITSPMPKVAIFGQVEVVADISPADDVLSVELFVDGNFADRVESSPFRFLIDVGQENVGHRLEIVARGRGDSSGSALLLTPEVRIDEEVDLGLQQLYITVSREDQRVLDLNRGDFQVTDDGRRQELVTFEHGDVPMVALLLLDASVSMRGKPLATALKGAEVFIAGMKPLDRAKLLLFSDRVVHTTPFTGFAQVLTTGLQTVTAEGGTALNDHLYMSLKLLEKRQGRRVIIVLSDGIDVASILSMRQVAWTARRSQALIYWIRLGNPNSRAQHSSAWRDVKQHQEERERLEELVLSTGGRILNLASIDETASAFDNILRELREQYVLGYYPSHPSKDGAWRKVRVKVRGQGLHIRTRDGYIDN